MTDVPFDLTDPPDAPPPAVRQPVLWRVAICLFRDHAPGLAGPGVLVRCRACGQVWPCRCRRFAERALIDACSPGPGTHESEQRTSEQRTSEHGTNESVNGDRYGDVDNSMTGLSDEDPG